MHDDDRGHQSRECRCRVQHHAQCRTCALRASFHSVACVTLCRSSLLSTHSQASRRGGLCTTLTVAGAGGWTTYFSSQTAIRLLVYAEPDRSRRKRDPCHLVCCSHAHHQATKSGDCRDGVREKEGKEEIGEQTLFISSFFRLWPLSRPAAVARHSDVAVFPLYSSARTLPFSVWRTSSFRGVRSHTVWRHLLYRAALRNAAEHQDRERGHTYRTAATLEPRGN